MSSRKLHGALLDCQLLSAVYIELLGGRQTSLELSKPKKHKEIEIEKTNNNKLYTIEITNEEINKHKKFSELTILEDHYDLNKKEETEYLNISKKDYFE